MLKHSREPNLGYLCRHDRVGLRLPEKIFQEHLQCLCGRLGENFCVANCKAFLFGMDSFRQSADHDRGGHAVRFGFERFPAGILLVSEQKNCGKYNIYPKREVTSV